MCYDGCMAILSVGSRVSKNEVGISFFFFNEQIGSLVNLGGISGIDRPTFQLFNPRKRVLYSVSETIDGSVHAYKIDDELHPDHLFSVPSSGDFPCHLSLSPFDEFIGVSNYGSGDFTLLSTQGETVFTERFEGVGFDPIRQEGSHIHSSLWSPDESFLYVADLGLDRIIRYPNDLSSKTIIDLPQGTGPRHMAFGRDGLLYVVAELSSEVLIYRGEELQQRISTLPSTFVEDNTASDLHLSKDGLYLYCSNRGHDSVAVFRVNQSLQRFEYCLTDKEPRSFALSPDGLWMLVANASSNTITIHRRNQVNGSVGEKTHRVAVKEPVCLTWMQG